MFQSQNVLGGSSAVCRATLRTRASRAVAAPPPTSLPHRTSMHALPAGMQAKGPAPRSRRFVAEASPPFFASAARVLDALHAYEAEMTHRASWSFEDYRASWGGASGWFTGVEVSRDVAWLARAWAKNMDALVEALDATEDQLDACAWMCEVAAAGGDVDALHTLCPLVAALCDRDWPQPPSFLTVQVPTGSALTALVAASARVAVGTGCSILAGPSTTLCVPDSTEVTCKRNAVTLFCNDDSGAALTGLEPGDIDARVSGGYTHILAMCPGAFTIMFTLECDVDDMPPTTSLSVSVCGVPVSGSPLSLKLGCAARGRTMAASGPLYNTASPHHDRARMAVTHDRKHMAVVHGSDGTVGLYRLQAGVCVHTFGPFACPVDVCAAPVGTLLVCEAAPRVTEVLVTGKVVRRMELAGAGVLSCVATNGECVCVGRQEGGVVVLSYATGLALCVFGGADAPVPLVSVSSLAFMPAPAAECVVVVDARARRLLTFNALTGQHIYTNSSDLDEPVAVAVTEYGEVCVTCRYHVHVLSPTLSYRRGWHSGGRSLDIGIATPHIYVLRDSDVVRVFM